MGVAAQVAARGLRRYGQALPAVPAAITPGTHGSGEQPSGIPQVELYIGGWLDVTALGLVRYQQQIKVSRGQPDENQRTNPSTGSFRLANKDGRFNPRNPLSPYYGLIDKNTPCRISVQNGNTKNYRFYGEIASWPQGWDPTGNDAWVDIQAAGILRRLGTGVNPLRSPIYLMWANATASNAAAAYWPMEEPTGATQFASGIGGAPMTIIGTPTLANNSNFVVSAPLPTLNGASFIGHIPTYTRTPASDLFHELYNDIECLFQLPTGGETTGTVVMSFTMSGALPLWEVYYSTASSGQVGLRGRNAAGTVVIDTGAVGSGGNGLAGQLSVQVYQSGADTFCQVALFDPFGVSIVQGFASLASTTCGIITSVTVNPGGGLQSTAVGHLSVCGFLVFGSGGQSAYNGYTGETAGIRFQRLCGAANVASELVYNPATSNTGPKMGPQHPGNLLDLLQESVDADGGILYELTDQLGLGYRCRDTIENQTNPVLALDYAQAHLAEVPTDIDDDQFTRNDVTVQRLNGSSQRAQQQTGPLNVANPPVGVGRYDTSITMSLYTDAQTADEAQWKVHLGTVPEPRYPNIAVQLARQEITSSPALRPSALAVMPGDRITVANPPAWLPPGPISAIALGYNETFDRFLHLIKWNTSPESAYRVAVCDDPFYGHADTDGSTLAAPLTSGLNPSPLFTGGDVSNWTGVHCTVTGAGPAPATVALPAGAPLSWGALLTPDGTASANAAKETAGFFPAAPSQTYQVSAYVYSPNGYSQVTLGFDWTDASHNVLSNGFSTTAVPAGVWTPLNTSQAADPAAVYGYPRVGQGGTPASTDLLYFAVVVAWQGTIQVATTNPGSPLWTTSAGDFPFDVAMGGERLTATGVTGSSSPQTFSVTRAVNGVVKAQSVNTAVQLWQPAIATL